MTTDGGTTVKLQVEPEECYQIKGVKIDGKEVDVPDTTKFSKEITVDHNIEVEVQIEPLYFLTVKYEKKSGDISSTPKCKGGSVTAVKEGTNIKITAEPDPNYRVSKVLKDGDLVPVAGTNGCEYATTIPNPSEDFTYQIWFALNQYEITAATEGNGKVSFEGDSDGQTQVVDHGGDVSVHIVPDVNYRVKRIVITEKDKEDV